MDTVKFNKMNARAVAHRGLSGIEPENTNAAFVAAGNRSYFGIETDIHRTADGRFIINHDGNLMRVGGEDIAVESANMSDMQKIILFDKDGSKSRADLRPTTLENYISICKKYAKHCVLELKSLFTDEETEKIIEIIKSYDYLDCVTFISFHYDNLLKVRKILPSHSVQFLTGAPFAAFPDGERVIDRLLRDRIDIDTQYGSVSEELISIMHGAGLLVNCWTVDNKEDGERLAEMGVDFITTNILE